MLHENDIWAALSEVSDPEIPVVSLVEMQIARAVKLEGDNVTVEMTPTFSGCPALEMMADAVRHKLHEIGVRQVTVQWLLDPPWSSEFLSEATRAKLKAFGIAPPPHHQGLIAIPLLQMAQCPFCGSTATHLDNLFGATLCRSLYYCESCRQSFDQLKPI